MVDLVHRDILPAVCIAYHERTRARIAGSKKQACGAYDTALEGAAVLKRLSGLSA